MALTDSKYVHICCQPDNAWVENGLPFIPFVTESLKGEECHEGDKQGADHIHCQSDLRCHAHAVLKDAAGHGPVHGL